MFKTFRLALVVAVLVPVFLGIWGPNIVASQGDRVRIALVLDGKIDDHGWNQAGYEGLRKAEELFGVEIAYSEQIPIPDFERVLRDYAAKQFDLVICHCTIAKDAVINTASDYPNVKFLWTDGDTTMDNLAVLVPMPHEASYLAGLLAGYMTRTGIVGMVGGIDVPSTHRSYAAFELGLKTVDPSIKLLVNWVGSFIDVAAGHEAALSQIEAGADIIFGNGDGQNLGVLHACSETKTYAIGAVWDQFPVAPDVVLTSVVWGLDEGIVRVVQALVEGNFEGRFYPLDLAHGSRLAPFHENEELIPHHLKTLLEVTEQKILNGELVIPVIDK